MLSLLLFAQLGTFLPTPERLLISASDEALGRAIVRSANQYVVGSVELLPLGAPPPPRVLRLVVLSDGPERLSLVLSRGAKLSVSRVLKIAGSHGSFDRAEAVALVIDDMRARLHEQLAPLERTHPIPLPRTLRPPGAALAMRLPVAPVPAPPAPPASAPVSETPPPPPPGPSTAALPPLRTLSDPAPQRPPAPPAPAPVLRSVLAPQPPPAPPSEPAQSFGRRWRIGLGVSLAIAGLSVGGLGVASLALDGRCVDDVVPCDYRFDGRTAGAVEVALGGAAVLAGLGLLTSLGFAERRAAQAARTALPAPLRSRAPAAAEDL